MLCMCICSNTFFNDFITINNNLNQFLLRRLVLFLIFLYFLLLPPTPTAATWLHWLLLRRREKQPKYFFHHGKGDEGEDEDEDEDLEELVDFRVKLDANIRAVSIFFNPLSRVFGITMVYNILILFLF